jgi:hypothetical protein
MKHTYESIEEKIVSKINYITPERYLTGVIRELDLKAANISILHSKGMLSDDEYNYLRSIPKIDREISIGNMINNTAEKNSSGEAITTTSPVYISIKDGIREAKLWLCQMNNIKEDEIIRVANDAVYINRPVPLQYTNNNGVEFSEKAVYSSLLQLNGIILFFRYNNDNMLEVDTKGLGKDNERWHNGFMLSVIGQVIVLLQKSSASDALNYLSKVYEDYILLRMPIGMYREFNSFSGFRSGNFYLSNEVGLDIRKIDIGYNLSLLRTLYGVILDQYMRGR